MAEAVEAEGGSEETGDGAGRSMGEKRLEAEKGEYTVDAAGDGTEECSSDEYGGDTDEEAEDALDWERWLVAAVTEDAAPSV